MKLSIKTQAIDGISHYSYEQIHPRCPLSGRKLVKDLTKLEAFILAKEALPHKEILVSLTRELTEKELKGILREIIYEDEVVMRRDGLTPTRGTLRWDRETYFGKLGGGSYSSDMYHKDSIEFVDNSGLKGREGDKGSSGDLGHLGSSGSGGNTGDKDSLGGLGLELLESFKAFKDSLGSDRLEALRALQGLKGLWSLNERVAMLMEVVKVKEAVEDAWRAEGCEYMSVDGLDEAIDALGQFAGI